MKINFYKYSFNFKLKIFTIWEYKKCKISFEWLNVENFYRSYFVFIFISKVIILLNRLICLEKLLFIYNLIKLFYYVTHSVELFLQYINLYIKLMKNNNKEIAHSLFMYIKY